MESETISFHSFRRGTGKSTLVANLAALLASRGRRVLILETAFHSPCMHIFFKLPEAETPCCLNDYFAGKCAITQATYDVTYRLPTRLPGQILLAPASPKVSEVVHSLRNPYRYEQIDQGLDQLKRAHQPDFILLDNPAGLHEETLLSIAVCDTMLLLLRPDQQDYQGTAVTLEVAHNLSVQRQFLIMNFAPGTLDRNKALQQLKEAYQCEVLAILPHAEEIAELASAQILALQNPASPLVPLFEGILARLDSAQALH